MNHNVLLTLGKYLWLIHTSGCPRNKAKQEILHNMTVHKDYKILYANRIRNFINNCKSYNYKTKYI